jgi:hypothetical protein
MPVLAGPDNCPLVANTPQADGDADGMGTACDPNDANADTDGDGCTDGKEAYRLTPMNPTDPKDWPDIDNNNVIGFNDFVPMLAAWNSNSSSGNWNPAADIDQNGTIGFGDFVVMLSRWNQNCT